MTTQPHAETARRKIAAKIEALLAKTTANGATEAEAIAAAAKAAELMREYQLTPSTAADLADEADLRYEERKHGHKLHAVRYCLAAMERMTCTCSYRTLNGFSVTFYGARHDVETAHGLLVMLKNAIDASWRAYAKAHPAARRVKGAERSYKLGCAVRLAERIHAQADLNRRRDAVERTFAADNPDMRTARKTQTNGLSRSVLGAGMEAGKEIGIGGLGGAAGPAMLPHVKE